MAIIDRIQLKGKTYELPHLPEGGEDGQVLTKDSNNEYNWKYYTPKIWKGTLTEYAQIIEKEDDCLYFIVESDINSIEEE